MKVHHRKPDGDEWTIEIDREIDRSLAFWLRPSKVAVAVIASGASGLTIIGGWGALLQLLVA